MKTKIMMAALALGLCAGAAQAADFRVGMVNIERVLRESVPALKAEKRIEKEFSGRDQENKRLEKQIKELQALLEKDAGTMTDVDHRNKERELNTMNVNLQRMLREFREDLSLRKYEELAIVQDQIAKAVKMIADTEKYDLILQDAVYYNPRIDITDKVIKYLAIEKPAAKDGK